MLCPVCNGFRPLEVKCPDCSQLLLDDGNWMDWTGPYAPYEPAVSLPEMYLSSGADICKHVGFCPACDDWYEVFIAKQE